MLKIKNLKPILYMITACCLLLLILRFEVYAGNMVIESKIADEKWQIKKALYPIKGQEVQLRIKKISGASIQWFQIIPDLSKHYKNANHPWEKNPYKWVGFGKIAYKKVELKTHRNHWQITPAFHSPFFFKPKYYHPDVGSFWIQAVVKKDNQTFKTPGIEKNDYRGISPDVFRISIRETDGYLGYLTAFFNVPGLFGSIPYQSYHFIGADCADVLIAAYTRWKGKGIPRDYNVAMLVNRFKTVKKFKMRSGNPNHTIRWHKDILPGDFIAVRYNKKRQFQHIGAVYKDENNNRLLDANDTVIHTGPNPLQVSKLKSGAFDGQVEILRP